MSEEIPHLRLEELGMWDTAWVPIYDILDLDESWDFGWIADRAAWDRHLAKVRRDMGYDFIVESLQRHGQTRPITVAVDRYDQRKMGDGHHRLAACIELGWSEILVTITDTSRSNAISGDSGSWRFDRAEGRVLA